MMWRIIIIIILIMCFAGAQIRESDLTEEDFINVTNRMDYDKLNLTFQKMGNDENNSFVVRTIYKAADLWVFVWVEGMITSLKYGYYNPQYNFELAWKLMLATMIAILVIPTIYILLFVGYGVVSIVNVIKGRKKNVKKNTRNNN